MKRSAFSVAASLIGFFSASTTVQAQTLWENTEAGMSRDELKKARPEVVEGEGYTCVYKIPEKIIAGYPMRVCFTNSGMGIP